jgi:two-component sensor histidine kinase
VSPANIALELNIEQVLLPVDKAIPCGLILNELITNALKHAFPGDRHGEIRVEFRQVAAHSVVLAVSDDGVGMTRELDLATSASLGMQLVFTLVEQLDGTIEVVRSHGMRFRITFPVEIEAHAPVPGEAAASVKPAPVARVEGT